MTRTITISGAPFEEVHEELRKWLDWRLQCGDGSFTIDFRTYTDECTIYEYKITYPEN